ncbi:Protein AATF [Linum perenne]
MGSSRKKTRSTKGSDSELEDSDGLQNEDLMTTDQDSDYEDAEEEENIDDTDQEVDDDEDESDDDEDESKEIGSSEEEEEGIEEIGLLKSNAHKDDELEDLEKEYKELRNQELNLLKNLKRHKEDDILKGQAVKNQKAIWDRSLELRILLQKPFSNSNRLPQEPIRSTFCNLDEGVKEAYDDLVVSSKKTLESLVELEESLLEKNPSISQSSSGNVGKSLKKHSNESTHLNDEDEEEWSRISQMHTRIAPFRNKSIDKWQRKTQVTTGAAAIRNKLHAFNQNISEQVAAYMRDPSRMVKQMQLRRSTAGVFGDLSVVNFINFVQATHPDGDPELLDDSEFYQQLLKEFLEKVDPNSSETAFYAVKRLQTKKRKIVDRRASKSRKIRYSVHEHIVNFMAPRPMDLPPMAPKLFENLLGVKTQKC